MSTFSLSILFLLAIIPPAHALGETFGILSYGYTLGALLLMYLLYRLVVIRRSRAPPPAAGEKRFDHNEHFGLTILTIGLWLPFWLLAWIIYKIRNMISKESK